MSLDPEYDQSVYRWVAEKCGGALPTCPMCKRQGTWKVGDPVAIPKADVVADPEEFEIGKLGYGHASALICRHCLFIAYFATAIRDATGRGLGLPPQNPDQGSMPS